MHDQPTARFGRSLPRLRALPTLAAVGVWRDPPGVVHVLPPLVGLLAFACATRWGPQLFADSGPYLQAAHNLRIGAGLVTDSPTGPEPFTHYPPLFPSVLAAIELLGIDGLSAIRLLNGTLFAINIALVGLAVWLTVRSGWARLLGACLALSSIDMLRVHTLAGTEPLFLAGELAALIFLARYARTRRPGHLLLAGLLAGLSLLDRYAGVVLVATGVVGLALLRGRSWAAVARDAVILVACSTAPMVVWLAYGVLLTGRVADRTVVSHIVGVDKLLSGLETVWAWALPFVSTLLSRYPQLTRPVDVLLVMLSIGVGVGAATYVARRRPRLRQLSSSEPLLVLGGVLCLIYLPFLLFSASFLENTPLDWRLLSPVCVVALVVLSVLAARAWRAARSDGRVVRMWQVGAAVGALLALYGVSGAFWVVNSFEDGRGYTSRTWRESPTLGALAQVPQDRWVVSNGPDVIYLLTGRTVDTLPVKADPFSFEPNPLYAEQMQAVRQRLQDEGGVVVWFDAITWRDYLPSRRELEGELNLRPVRVEGDGTIYRAAGP